MLRLHTGEELYTMFIFVNNSLLYNSDNIVKDENTVKKVKKCADFAVLISKQLDTSSISTEVLNAKRPLKT
jgi:hypothetical protein